jgi:uncharacterized membrane protein
MADTEEYWTKWWWATYFADFQAWTAEERKVRMALGMSAIPVMLVLYITADVLLEWFGVERTVAALLAGLISTVFAFYSARPIATVLYPDLLRKADENARRRLSANSSEVR